MSSLSLASLGENLQAKIGSGVNKDALNGLVFSLGREGAEALRKGDYETALDRFSACVKVNEKICKPDDINYGASLHNMATALHYLGEIKQAEEFYEKAKAVFERQPSGAFRPSQRHRIKFIEERLTLLRFGAKPANDTYIDEFGVERPTSQRDDPMRETLQLSEKAEKQYWKGVNFAKNKIWGLAQECFEDAIALADRSEGAVSPERLMLCHNNLGVVLEEQGRLDDAVAELHMARRMMRQLPGGAEADPDRYQKLQRIEQRLRACESRLAMAREHGDRMDFRSPRDSPRRADDTGGHRRTYRDDPRHRDDATEHAQPEVDLLGLGADAAPPGEPPHSSGGRPSGRFETYPHDREDSRHRGRDGDHYPDRDRGYGGDRSDHHGGRPRGGSFRDRGDDGDRFDQVRDCRPYSDVQDAPVRNKNEAAAETHYYYAPPPPSAGISAKPAGDEHFNFDREYMPRRSRYRDDGDERFDGNSSGRGYNAPPPPPRGSAGGGGYYGSGDDERYGGYGDARGPPRRGRYRDEPEVDRYDHDEGVRDGRRAYTDDGDSGHYYHDEGTRRGRRGYKDDDGDHRRGRFSDEYTEEQRRPRGQYGGGSPREPRDHGRAQRGWPRDGRDDPPTAQVGDLLSLGNGEPEAPSNPLDDLAQLHLGTSASASGGLGGGLGFGDPAPQGVGFGFSTSFGKPGDGFTAGSQGFDPVKAWDRDYGAPVTRNNTSSSSGGGGGGRPDDHAARRFGDTPAIDPGVDAFGARPMRTGAAPPPTNDDEELL